MKKRKNVVIFLTLTLFLLIFALTVQSQQKPVAGQATQPQPLAKAPSLDPSMVRSLQGKVTRSTMVNTLMGNQATRMTLENLAKSAKIQVNELSIKTLDGNSVSPAPQGQQIDQLNWNAGIKFSMIKNRPTVFHPPTNRTLPVGSITSRGWVLDSESMHDYINNDIFFISSALNLELILRLPLPHATYMIAVQIDSIMPPEITISDRNPNRKIQNVIPLTSRDGFIGLTQISPHPYMEGINTCNIEVKFDFPYDRAQYLFGGFTITRL